MAVLVLQSLVGWYPVLEEQRLQRFNPYISFAFSLVESFLQQRQPFLEVLVLHSEGLNLLHQLHNEVVHARLGVVLGAARSQLRYVNAAIEVRRERLSVWLERLLGIDLLRFDLLGVALAGRLLRIPRRRLV